MKSATAPIDLYVFVGLFINVYQVIKLKTKKILESSEVIEKCSDRDPEKFFFNKTEVSSGFLLSSCKYYEERNN